MKKYVLKNIMIYLGINWNEKWKSTLNAYLNKTLTRKRNKLLFISGIFEIKIPALKLSNNYKQNLPNSYMNNFKSDLLNLFVQLLFCYSNKVSKGDTSVTE